jgi:hypothetical protein
VIAQTATSSLSSVSGWVPYQLFFQDNQALCRWLHVGREPFSEPFFDDTISKCKSKSVHQYHSLSNVAVLPGWAGKMEAVAPTAFIFHISRCGSTLLSQLLDINPEHIVLSEVPFFDEVLRAPVQGRWTENVPAPEIFKAAMQLYGQKRTGIESRLFIKTDSWHVCFYKTLRELYPDVPFIFLYRDPGEVIRSQQKKRGMQAVPGVVEAEVFGFDNEPVTDLDVYMSRVMERYFTLFKEIMQTDHRSLLVNYNEGMMKVAAQTASFAGVHLSEEDREKMELRCRYNAKYPDQVFSEAAIETAPPEYLRTCMKLYNELEAMRNS